MFRLLIVEDQVDFYEDYLLRLFGKLLPLEKISITHAPTLDAALAALQEPWDAVLMDYSLGPKTEFLGESVRDGADLVRFRRAIEEKTGQPKAYIMGMSSNNVGNRLIQERGADTSLLKLQVPEMAKLISGRIKA
jgi:CheY-like chemotaxis protein